MVDGATSDAQFQSLFWRSSSRRPIFRIAPIPHLLSFLSPSCIHHYCDGFFHVDTIQLAPHPHIVYHIHPDILIFRTHVGLLLSLSHFNHASAFYLPCCHNAPGGALLKSRPCGSRIIHLADIVTPLQYPRIFCIFLTHRPNILFASQSIAKWPFCEFSISFLPPSRTASVIIPTRPHF